MGIILNDHQLCSCNINIKLICFRSTKKKMAKRKQYNKNTSISKRTRYDEEIEEEKSEENVEREKEEENYRVPIASMSFVEAVIPIFPDLLQLSANIKKPFRLHALPICENASLTLIQ